ncbi:MAG TPA: crotonase/enoyl-CoA hydratase family protein [Acidimicrobiales bacterium]|nr:crotonase/enoyl-CoA hydratase family protein [Acidimicrobiales bacterium]
MTDPVQLSIEDGVAVVRLDDGKANAISHRLLEQLHEALDRAAAEASAVALIGREGRFSAGFDLSVMTQGADATRGLVKAGGELLMRLYTHPQPTVAAVTGHALAAGVLLTIACDTRIGSADLPAKIGLNETAIGMGLPWYGIRLGEARLSIRHRQRAVLQAELYDMAGALDAGYLDELVDGDAVVDTAIERARALGQLPGSAYSFTKRRLRQALADEVLGGLDADMETMVPPTPA